MEIRSPRLLIRPPQAGDAAGALVMLTDPDTARWNPAPEVVDLESARAWCESGADWSDGTHATWHAVDPENGELIANISIFSIDRGHRTAKIGYRVAPARRLKGYAREALTAVTQWAFTEGDLLRIQLEHVVENEASCRVALGAGYLLEGITRGSYAERSGERHDDHIHGRLASDPAP